MIVQGSHHLGRHANAAVGSIHFGKQNGIVRRRLTTSQWSARPQASEHPAIARDGRSY